MTVDDFAHIIAAEWKRQGTPISKGSDYVRKMEHELRSRYDIDMRMRPCRLEIQGQRARLVLDEDAPLVGLGPGARKDPNIVEGIGSAKRMLDTFQAVGLE